MLGFMEYRQGAGSAVSTPNWMRWACGSSVANRGFARLRQLETNEVGTIGSRRVAVSLPMRTYGRYPDH